MARLVIKQEIQIPEEARQLTKELGIFMYFLLIGSLVFSAPTMASLALNEQLSDELARLNQSYTAGIFFVKPDDDSADSIRRYLPSARTAMECKEKLVSGGSSCEQSRKCLPNIEFLKINPTKYRIKILHACRNFSFIFSERFDPGWKSYIVKISNETEEEYLKFNKEKQSHMPKLATDWNTSYGAIENTSLPKRHIWETWLSGEVAFKYPDNAGLVRGRNGESPDSSGWRYVTGFNGASVKWPDLFHWKANTFANSWFFDLQGVKTLPQTLHSQDGYYIQNSDGSVNFEVVIEYWPQRLLDLAYIISAISIFLCLSAVVYMKPRK